MSFLYRTPSMTKREAREILDLHELVRYSLESGPVPLDFFADRIRHVKSDEILSKERHARRLVARLARLGYLVATHGDAENLTLDFGQDEALRAEVERSVDDAQKKLTGEEDEEGDEEGTDVLHPIPYEAVRVDHQLGMDVRRLAARYGIPKDKVQRILSALRVKPHPEGRPSVQLRRSVLVLQEALGVRPVDGTRKNGHTAEVARILGCSRWTARRFLQSVNATRNTPPGGGLPPVDPS